MPQLPPSLAALERRLGVPEGSLTDTDRARAEDALSDATALVLAEVTSTVAEAWLLDAPAVVNVVALKSARREYENPRGYTETNAGDVSASVSVASGVFLTDEERRQIHRAAGTDKPFLGSVRIASPYSL